MLSFDMSRAIQVSTLKYKAFLKGHPILYSDFTADLRLRSVWILWRDIADMTGMQHYNVVIRLASCQSWFALPSKIFRLLLSWMKMFLWCCLVICILTSCHQGCEKVPFARTHSRGGIPPEGRLGKCLVMLLFHAIPNFNVWVIGGIWAEPDDPGGRAAHCCWEK